jgi:DNA-binding NtrC family response regulator
MLRLQAKPIGQPISSMPEHSEPSVHPELVEGRCEPALHPEPVEGAYPINASLSDVEKVHIERVLQDKNWNQSAAAQVLGIDRKTLRNKIREFKLDRGDS